MKGQSLLTYNSSLLSQTHPARLAASARAALDRVISGQIAIEPTTEYELADAPRAIEELASGQSSGKIILRVAA